MAGFPGIPIIMKTSASQGKPALSQKVVWGILDALERHLFTQNFIVSNLTPYHEIYREDIMTVRHYLPLQGSRITIGEHSMAVSESRHRVPLVLVPPLAATSMIFDLLPQRSVVRYFYKNWQADAIDVLATLHLIFSGLLMFSVLCEAV